MLFLLLKTLKISKGACLRTRLEVLTHDLSIFWALRTALAPFITFNIFSPALVPFSAEL